MPPISTNLWVIFALVLVLGWFLGLLTFSGGRKWRRAYEQERSLRIAADENSARLATRIADLEGERERRIEVEKERDAHLARSTAAGERIAELERDRPAVNPDTAGSIAAAASGKRDDLARIYGIGRGGEVRLNDLGVHSYADIMQLSSQDEAALEGRLGLAPGTIADERWREQAEILRKGDVDEHARRFA